MTMTKPAISIRGLRKSFTLHLRGGIRLDALRGVDLDVHPGECVVLRGPSGAGKSSLMRCVYGNYGADAGHLVIRHDGAEIDMATAGPRQVTGLRRDTIGYVSQFLRVIPRVSTRDVVAEPMLARGIDGDTARGKAEAILERLNIPHRLFDLPPATFSGGEQQRVNIARVFAAGFPVLLLDEPTASLDDANRAVVIALIREARDAGAAILAILHDPVAREAVASRIFELEPGTSVAEAA
jgi:alpha-D-ribose 1-methylphosphonate 5-triphosphate synthase subunit PhnL